MEEIKDEESYSWDKKKIIAALLFLVLLGYGVKIFAFDSHKDLKSSNSSKSVIGTSIEKKITPTDQPEDLFSQRFNLQKTLQDKLEDIKAEVQHINIAEIASSSPQVQKALNDLKALEQYPKNQAKELCQKICSSF